jgi:hypothetical protein
MYLFVHAKPFMSENNKTPYMKIYASEIAEKLIYHEL